jgi:hypothetical protein
MAVQSIPAAPVVVEGSRGGWFRHVYNSTLGKAVGLLGPRSRLQVGQAPPVPPVQPFQEQGSGGTAVWGGVVQVKDRSPKWIGQQRWQTASDLAVNISVVGAGIHYFLNLISHPKWKAKPSDLTDKESVELAEFVDHVINDMIYPWESIVRSAGMYRFHGFSIQEWIAKKITTGKYAGRIGFENIEVRPQHTIELWGVSDKGSVLGVWQRNPQTSQLQGLPRGKLVYITEDLLTDSPEGLGVLRHLAEPYNRLLRLQQLEMRAYERDLRGIPVGRAPIAEINKAVKANLLSQEDANRLVGVIENIVQLQVKMQDTGVVLDSQPFLSTTAGGPAVSAEKMWSLELLNGPALGLAEISQAMDRIQREMARIMGIEHLMIGDQGGNRAVAQDKSRNVYLIASSVLRLLRSCMQKDVVDVLWLMNGLPEDKKPKLESEDISPKDVVEITTALARMSQSGATLAPDDPVVNDIRDLLGVSRAKPIDPTALLGPDGNPLSAKPNGAMPGEANTTDEDQRLPRVTDVNRDPGMNGAVM